MIQYLKQKKLLLKTDLDLLGRGIELESYGDRGGPEPEEAFNAWIKMIEERYKKHIYRMPTDEHPSFMLEKISKLNNNQFGHNLFGLGETIKRNQKTI